MSVAEALSPKVFRRKIADFLGANPGLICSECLAATLSLPEPYVAMTTIGLGRLDHFESASHHACSRCGAQTRVIREHAESMR